MKVILDSAVFINTTSFPFTSKNEYVIPPACVVEIKEPMSKMRLDAALVERRVSIQGPSPPYLRTTKELAETHGVLQLTRADMEVIALALEFHSTKEKICVYTDDYSIQNVLKWEKIPFEGVLQGKITQKRSFRKK